MFISNIRQCYNSSSTLFVNRLPPEVLQMVFHYLLAPPSTLYWSSYENRDDDNPYRRLTRAMFVCRKWHSIAIQTASLWTEIDLAARPSSASYLLERSRAAPIHLRAAIHKTNNQLVKSVTQHHGDRVFKLEFWGRAKAEPEAYALLDVAMPALRQLKLTFRRRSDSPACPYLVKSECFPALRALVLEGSLLVSASVVPHLTHINVKDVTDVDVSSLWDLLCSAPMLEVLEMSAICGLTVARGPAPASSLTLPRLQNLKIRGAYTNAVHYLVSRLELPCVTDVFYEYLFAYSGTLLERLLPSSLATHTPTRVTLVISGNYNIFSAGFEGDGQAVTLSYLRSRELDIPSPEERARWPFTTFPTLLSLVHVTEFRLASSVWDPDSLRRLGVHLANVTTLCVATHFDVAKIMELGAALSSALLADDPVVFPTLLSLDIDTEDLPRELIGVINPVLAKRDRDGRRLQSLCVHVDAVMWPKGWPRDDTYDRLKATGLFDHVDRGYPKRSGWSSKRDWESQVEHTPRAPAHGYW